MANLYHRFDFFRDCHERRVTTTSGMIDFYKCLVFNDVTMAELIFFMIYADYGIGVHCFFLGKWGVSWIAIVIQALFVAFELAVEYFLYRKLGRPLDGKVVQSFCGINVSRLGIPLWIYNWIIFSPNYVQVQTCWTLAGASWTLWYSSAFHAAREHFQSNWSHVWLIGPAIGYLGIPLSFIAFLLYNTGFHILFAHYIKCRGIAGFHRKVCVHEFFDVANLQFLASCFRDGIFRDGIFLASLNCDLLAQAGKLASLVLARIWSVVTVKLPTMWLKISWWSVAYDFIMNNEQERFTVLLALGTGWYSILQLVPTFSRAASEAADNDEKLCALLPFVLLVLLIVHQGLHFGGVVLCPSRDFSITYRGCTPYNHPNHTVGEE